MATCLTFEKKTADLDLRPVYYKADAAFMAHLHFGLLAYWLVSTIRYQLKLQGKCSEPTQEVRQICSKLKYNEIPLKRKKSVWHTGEILKNERSHYHAIMDG